MSYNAFIAPAPGARDDSSYERTVATWYPGQCEPPTSEEYDAAIAAWLADAGWRQFRGERQRLFDHWAPILGSMAALGYPPYLAAQADIVAGYQALLDAPVALANDLPVAMELIRTADVNLVTALNRQGIYP